MLFQLLGDLLSPAGRRGKLTILIFHRVVAAPEGDGAFGVDTFRDYMKLLKEEFRVLPLGDACARLAAGALPARAACITFDDGYADNETVAFPVLAEHGLHATFFVSPAFSDGSVMFNDAVMDAVRRAPSGEHDLSRLDLGMHQLSGGASRTATALRLIDRIKYRHPRERQATVERVAEALQVTLPRNLMMDAAQIKRLHDAGMEIGGHTLTHPILSLLGDEEAHEEIVAGKRRLEEIIGAPLKLFAYPNGKPGEDYGPRDVRLVREAGFSAAVSTMRGSASSRSDPFQLPRYAPFGPSAVKLGLRMLASCAREAPVPGDASPRTTIGADR